MNRRGLLGLGAASAVGVLAGCAMPSEPASPPSTPSSPAAPKLDPATRTALDSLLEDQLAATGVPGLAGLVRIGTEVWRGSAGVADLTSEQPYSADGFVRIASNTKTYTATAVLMLVDEGRIGLSDPLERYVPGVVNGKVATIEDLLGMRSGIPDFTADEEFNRRFDADPDMAWTDQDTLAVIARSKAAFAPGERVAYCDSNYALLGMVMRKVTGRPPGETITEKIIGPLRLTKTSYPTLSTVPDPHPTGYIPTTIRPDGQFDNDATEPRPVPRVNPAVAGTAGAMISTVDELHTWGLELVKGSLLKPQTQRKRLEFRRFTGQPINVGYGLGILNLNEFLGHDGAIFGYSSVVLTRPQTDCSIVFVANESSNSTTPTLTVATAVIKQLYPDQLR